MSLLRPKVGHKLKEISSLESQMDLAVPERFPAMPCAHGGRFC